MPEEAPQISLADSTDTSGLEDLFSCHDKERHQDLTLEEAAKTLNLSERTVQRRLKQGQLRGYKVDGSRGPEWRVQLSSTEDTTASESASSQDTTFPVKDMTITELVSSQDATPSSQDTTFISENLSFSSHDTTFAESLSSQDTSVDGTTVETEWYSAEKEASGNQSPVQASFEPELKVLLDVITKQAEKLEAASMRIGYLEARTENYEREIKLLTDSRYKRGWWANFGNWFLGRKS